MNVTSELQNSPDSARTLNERLAILKCQESDLLQKLKPLIKPGESFAAHEFNVMLFVMGAAKRTIAQSAGFRAMLDARNFPCASGLLRMQIDTAMRLNSLYLIADKVSFLESWTNGKKISSLKCADGKRLQDYYLLQKLGERFAWTSEVYRQTSSFVHFSARHAFATVSAMDDETGNIEFHIGPTDPERPEHSYYEIVAAFEAANEMNSELIVSIIK